MRSAFYWQFLIPTVSKGQIFLDSLPLSASVRLLCPPPVAVRISNKSAFSCQNPKSTTTKNKFTFVDMVGHSDSGEYKIKRNILLVYFMI